MYNNICTTIIALIIPVLGEIWRKGSNFAGLLLVNVFAKVTKINTEALPIKSYQPRQKHCQGSAEANVFSYGYLGILFAVPKNTEIRGLRNSDRKIMQHIRISSRTPMRIGKWN